MFVKPTVGITGANGKVGTVLVRELGNEFSMRLFTHDGNFKRKEILPSNAVVKKMDVEKPRHVKGAFDGLDVVIHLAVAGGGPREDWENIKDANIDGMYNVLEEAVRSKVKRFIYASTNHVQNAACWDDSSKDPESFDQKKLESRKLHLRDIAFPDSFYGVSKLFGEEMCKFYAAKHNLECISLRIGWLNNGDKDDPTPVFGTAGEKYMKAIYLSHRDCANAFKHAVTLPLKRICEWIPYSHAYLISDNANKPYDLDETMTNLSWKPIDSIETFIQQHAIHQKQQQQQQQQLQGSNQFKSKEMEFESQTVDTNIG